MKKRRKFVLLQEWNNNKDHIAWIFKQGKGFGKYTIGFLFISLVGMIISLVSSVAGKFVVDAATGFDSEPFWKYIFLMMGTTVVTIVLSFISAIFSSYVGEKFTFSIRAVMFDRVQRGKWYEISKFHSADILSRLNGDVNVIAHAIISIVPNIIVAVIEIIIIAIILFYYDPVMAIIGFVIGPLGLILSSLVHKKFSIYQKQLRESESEYYSFFQETFSNIPITKVFQMEDDNNQYFDRVRGKRLSVFMKSSKLSAFMGACMKLVYSLGYVIAFSWCAYRLSKADSGYTYGTMTLFLSLVSILQSTIRGFGSIIPQTFSTIISAKRLREITDITSEYYTENSVIPEQVGVKINNVKFTYEDEMVLNDISLNVKPGEHVGIIGTSGAGKTTLIRLLLALVEPDEGEVSYIVNNEEELASPETRRFISYVPQGNTLFSGTIRSNLLIADSNATDEQLWEALRLACADDFVSKMPNGLDTHLSEKAGGISEGQAQRIAIARALLRNRPILILDEATSALDESTESMLLEKLVNCKDKTMFIITHRSSMLKYCDKVMKII